MTIMHLSDMQILSYVQMCWNSSSHEKCPFGELLCFQAQLHPTLTQKLTCNKNSRTQNVTDKIFLNYVFVHYLQICQHEQGSYCDGSMGNGNISPPVVETEHPL